MVGGELVVRSIATPPPLVADDCREEVKLYMSFEPSCLGSGAERDGEAAGEGLERLFVGELLPGWSCPASTEGRVFCLSDEAFCCARLRLRLSGGEVGV